MIGITEISAALAAAGVLVGVVYYILDMRNQTKMRQTDLIMRLHTHSCTKEVMEAMQKVLSIKFDDYDDFVDKYGPWAAETPEWTAILIVGQFMEGIGVLLHRKLADAEAIHELFDVETVWRKFEPLVMGIRSLRPNSRAYEYFYNMYEEVQKIEQKLQ
jgi:hypothetical protein